MSLAIGKAGPTTRRRELRMPRGLRRLLVPLLLVLAWQAAASAGLIGTRAVPSPVEIATAFHELIASGELLANLLVSLGRVAIGLGIGVVVGSLLALVAGLSRWGEDSVDATVQMVRTLPHLALVALFILWFGIGETPKVALVALGSAFPIYLNLFAGIRGVDPKIVEAAGTLGLSRVALIRHVVLPGALPSFLVGLRYALGLAWLSLVVGEQINATAGIGCNVPFALANGARVLERSTGYLSGNYPVTARAGALDEPPVAAALGDYLGRLRAAYRWVDADKEAWADVWSAAIGVARPTVLDILTHPSQDFALLPVTDEAVSSLQTVADTFLDLRILPRRIDAAALFDRRYHDVLAGSA